MFYSLKDRFRRMQFAGQCRGVLATKPVELDPSSPLAILGLLQHKDLLLYLLALKSFARQVRPGAVYVVNDGSLNQEDAAILHKHVPGLSVLDLERFRTAACPRGGCWERLLAIAELVKDHYVIQLDSDTLTVGPIDEVRQCVAGGTAFALGTWDNQDFEPMTARCAHAQALDSGADAHIQLIAEANFDKLADYHTLRYVRGCAGFAGFAQGSFSKDFVENISQQMRAAIGDKWSAWGSEQVMSNIVVANIAKSVVLPHPKYADCTKMKPNHTAFIHFIGSCRFSNGVYAEMGRRTIAAL